MTINIASKATVLQNAISAGSVLIKTEDFNAVSSVILSDVFSADYWFYRLTLACTTTNANSPLIRWRTAGGSDATGNYQRSTIAFAAGSLTGSTSSSDSQVALSLNIAGDHNVVFDVMNPFDAAPTRGVLIGSVTTDIRVDGLRHNESTSYPSFNLFVSAGTFGGRLTVHGLRK
jgi:hypothetical protein